MRFLNRKNEEKKEERFILSIDGGGVRGIVPAVIISALASLADDGIPFYSHFDLIAGTSTGGLLALALSSRGEGEPYAVYSEKKKGFFTRETTLDGYIEQGHDPHSLTSLYFENAGRIFSDKSILFEKVFADKYSSRGLDSFAKGYFGEQTLSDLLLPVLLISYDTKAGGVIPLSSYNKYSYFTMREAARATTAAPTYFPPLFKDGMCLIDGGVAANNPALYAYAEARRLYPSASRFHILSLSTARQSYSFTPDEGWGGVGMWAQPITQIYPHAQMETAKDVLCALPDVDFVRIEAEENAEKIKMDDVSPQAMNTLKAIGEELAKKNKDKLESYAELLKAKTDFSSAFREGNNGFGKSGSQTFKSLPVV